MSTMKIIIGDQECKLDQVETLVLPQDHTMVVGIDNYIPERSKLDQKDDTPSAPGPVYSHWKHELHINCDGLSGGIFALSVDLTTTREEPYTDASDICTILRSMGKVFPEYTACEGMGTIEETQTEFNGIGTLSDEDILVAYVDGNLYDKSTSIYIFSDSVTPIEE